METLDKKGCYYYDESMHNHAALVPVEYTLGCPAEIIFMPDTKKYHQAKTPGLFFPIRDIIQGV